MTTRVLPREEWGRLNSGHTSMLGLVSPENVSVVVVEDGSEIVAHILVIRMTHFESLWCAPKYRGNAGVTLRLLRSAFAAAEPWSNGWVLGAAGDDHMRDLLSRVGGERLPTDSYILAIGGRDA